MKEIKQKKMFKILFNQRVTRGAAKDTENHYSRMKEEKRKQQQQIKDTYILQDARLHESDERARVQTNAIMYF